MFVRKQEASARVPGSSVHCNPTALKFTCGVVPAVASNLKHHFPDHLESLRNTLPWHIWPASLFLWRSGKNKVLWICVKLKTIFVQRFHLEKRGTATLKGSSIGRSSCSKPSEHNRWIPAMASFESLATTFSPPIFLPEPPRLASKTVILRPPLEQDVSCAVLFSSLHSCLFRAATVSRWYVCWSPKLTTGHKRIWDLANTMQLLETMRSDLSVWTHVACMSWFGAGLCSMVLNGCSHVLEPWISHVVHISFAQRLSLSCGYSQAFCLWLVQHWDESHVFSFPRGLCHIWDVNGCPKANLPQQISNLLKGWSVNWGQKCVRTEGQTAYSW